MQTIKPNSIGGKGVSRNCMILAFLMSWDLIHRWYLLLQSYLAVPKRAGKTTLFPNLLFILHCQSCSVAIFVLCSVAKILIFCFWSSFCLHVLTVASHFKLLAMPLQQQTTLPASFMTLHALHTNPPKTQEAGVLHHRRGTISLCKDPLNLLSLVPCFLHKSHPTLRKTDQ